MSRCSHRIEAGRRPLRTCVRVVTDFVRHADRDRARRTGTEAAGAEGRGGTLVDGVVGSTSIGCLLFSFPLLAPLRISPRRPIGIELHVQLAFSARQLVILGLLLAAERMPLYREHAAIWKQNREMHLDGGLDRSTGSSATYTRARKTDVH